MPKPLFLNLHPWCYSSDHMSYGSHQCQSAYKKNVQVPMCPLCNKPVPTPRGQEPDFSVGQHIDNDCRFTEGKKVITNYINYFNQNI